MARSRSPQVHQKILDAVLRLMAERGLDGTSMDAIAEQAGVSKMTIYNHWPNKDSLFLEALADLHGLRSRPAFDSGDVRVDMIAVLAWQPARRKAALQARIWPDFMAYAARNQRFGDMWRDTAMEPPRRELTRLLQKAFATGELPSMPPIEQCLSLLLGPMLYQRIFLGKKAVEPAQYAQMVVEAFWRSFQLPSKYGRETKRVSSTKQTAHASERAS